MPKDNEQGDMVSAIVSRKCSFSNWELTLDQLDIANEKRENSCYVDETTDILKHGKATKDNWGYLTIFTEVMMEHFTKVTGPTRIRSSRPKIVLIA